MKRLTFPLIIVCIRTLEVQDDDINSADIHNCYLNCVSTIKCEVLIGTIDVSGLFDAVTKERGRHHFSS